MWSRPAATPCPACSKPMTSFTCAVPSHSTRDTSRSSAGIASPACCSARRQMPPTIRVRHAVEVANLRQAQTNLSVTAVNVSASATRLAAALGPRGSAGGWTFLSADKRQMAASLATAQGNTGRATAVQDRLQAMQAHADAVQQHAETRANTYATLLLAVAAGAFAGAALPSQHRAAAAAALGGALFVIGLLVVDAARPYLRIHRLLARSEEHTSEL